jgi:hypothetical protein
MNDHLHITEDDIDFEILIHNVNIFKNFLK